jgi:predicted NBD/HSP70 family sugar kinase
LLQFERYGDRLAHFLYSLCVSFCPQQIVISGGFSHSAELFLPKTEQVLKGLLRTRREGHDLLPKIKMSHFKDEAGILGAARVAFLQK